MIKSIINYLSNLKTTLVSPVMLGFISIHTLEDVALLSIGRFVPLPVPLMYAFGLFVSWVILGTLVQRFTGKK
tara:strand:- start:3539 stop:3757 length:219 start_codon:yes stop_codon:yes gene_type:complete